MAPSGTIHLKLSVAVILLTGPTLGPHELLCSNIETFGCVPDTCDEVNVAIVLSVAILSIATCGVVVEDKLVSLVLVLCICTASLVGCANTPY